ncbi:MAG: hypothetical protein ABL985_13485 [Casimicrobium sp.]
MEKLRNISIRMLAQSRRAAAAWVIASVALVAARTGVAVAQGSSNGSVTVTPAIAVVDTARRIVIRGNWANACPPSTAEIVADTSPTPAQLTVRLNEIFTFAACAQVITPFTYEVNYTPRVPGVLPVVVVTSGGQKVAEGRMTTVSKDDALAAVNLTGAWFESPTAKSLLMVSHSQTNPDALVGTWTLFDYSGRAIPMLFHSSRRTDNPKVYLATIAPMVSERPTWVGVCGLNAPPIIITACPSETGLKTGYEFPLRIEVLSDREIRVQAFSQGAFIDQQTTSGSVLSRFDF